MQNNIKIKYNKFIFWQYLFVMQWRSEASASWHFMCKKKCFGQHAMMFTDYHAMNINWIKNLLIKHIMSHSFTHWKYPWGVMSSSTTVKT